MYLTLQQWPSYHPNLHEEVAASGPMPDSYSFCLSLMVECALPYTKLANSQHEKNTISTLQEPSVQGWKKSRLLRSIQGAIKDHTTWSSQVTAPDTKRNQHLQQPWISWAIKRNTFLSENLNAWVQPLWALLPQKTSFPNLGYPSGHDPRKLS